MTRSRRVLFLLPQSLIPTGSSEPPSPSPNSSADHQMAFRVIGLAMLIHMLRSRRFYERAAFAAIVLAALAAMNQESSAKALAGLVAWAKRQDERLSKKGKPAPT